MGAKFRGHKTAFNPSGSNDVTPKFMSAPVTDFKGRGAVPSGKLKRYPAAVADAEDSNRRYAKAAHGSGDGSGVNFCTPTAFGNKRGGTTKARTYNTGGGVGSGFRKGSKTP